MLEGMWRSETRIRCWWECTAVWPQWKTVTSFLTMLNRIIKWPRNSTPRNLRKRAENRCLNKTCMNVHSSTGYSSQKEQTTQVSTSGRMDRQNAVCPRDGILSSFMNIIHEKEGSPGTHYTMDKSSRQYAQWEKPDTEGRILYDSI